MRSEHPLGKAIVASARAESLEVPEPEAFEMLPGKGVAARVESVRVQAGNMAMMEESGLQPDAWRGIDVAAMEERGWSVTYLALGGKAAGVVALTDTIRQESAGMVARLKKLGVTPVLLTGDNPAAASAIAGQVVIDDYLAECRPEDKLGYIENAEQAGEFAIMVGDGVNDAPALRRSYVGVALGGVGSDIAVEAADIAIVEDCIDELPHLLALSKHMMRVIKANLTFSMTLNFVAIVLAMVAVLDPVSGALVHNCGSVFVIINSALLLGWSAREGSRV